MCEIGVAGRHFRGKNLLKLIELSSAAAASYPGIALPESFEPACPILLSSSQGHCT